MMESEYWTRRRQQEANTHSQDANYAGPRDGYRPTQEKPMTPDTPKPPLSDQLYAAWTVLERVMPAAAEMYRPLYAEQERDIRAAEVEHWVRRYNELEQWRIQTRQRAEAAEQKVRDLEQEKGTR